MREAFIFASSRSGMVDYVMTERLGSLWLPATLASTRGSSLRA